MLGARLHAGCSGRTAVLLAQSKKISEAGYMPASGMLAVETFSAWGSQREWDLSLVISAI